MFQLDLKSRKSIYEQVIDNLKELIMTEVLESGSKLPSVRELSKQITVNPNTVQKAFKELEREGFIYKVKGRGTFVSPRQDSRIDPQAVRKVCADIRNSVQELSYLGVPAAEIKKMVADIAADPFDEAEDKKEGYL